MINIVIPMAGAGTRFKNAGFLKPKPFIEFDGKMMIEHVLLSFKSLNAKIILVIQQEFFVDQNVQLELLKTKYNVDFVVVPKLTMGAAITALAAHKKIIPKYDIIFADSDNIFNPKDIYNFVDYVRKNDLAGALLTFNSNEKCFSYVKINKNGTLIETKEKEVISTHAISGVYYFKTLELFKDAVIDLIVDADLTNGEFYMSNVYNHLQKFTNKIGIYDIDHFDCVGTPEKLRMYKNGGSSEEV